MTLNRWLKCLRSDCWNQRYTLCVMGLIGCTSMSASSACWYQVLQVITSKQREEEPEFPWSTLEQSLAKASYFIGFLSTSIPGSLLAECFGGKVVFGVGCTCSGLGAILTPTVIKSAGLGGIVGLRIIIGAAEAMVIPAGLNLFSRWLLPRERGLMVGVFLTGPQLGIMIGHLASGYMIQEVSWLTSLHIWGGICLAYCAIFYFLCYSEPRDHPFISYREWIYLSEYIPTIVKDKGIFGLRHILTSFRVWCIVVCTVGFYWCFYTLVMDLPRYTDRVLDFGIAERGAMMSIPFTLMYVTNLSSCYVADFFVQRRVLRRWVLRRVCVCLSSVPPGVTIVGAYYCGSGYMAETICLFALSLIFMSFYYCGLQINTMKLSPRNLSLVIAFVNTFGAIAALLATVVHGFITSRNEESEWHIVGWISGVLLACGIFMYVLCGAAERRWWDEQANVDETNYKRSVRIQFGNWKNVEKEIAKQTRDEERRLEEAKLKPTEPSGASSGLKRDEDDKGRSKLKGILKTDKKEPVEKDVSEERRLEARY